jgi:hypothetical protein
MDLSSGENSGSITMRLAPQNPSDGTAMDVPGSVPGGDANKAPVWLLVAKAFRPVCSPFMANAFEAPASAAWCISLASFSIGLDFCARSLAPSRVRGLG